jgi:hypothetical protein
MRKSYVMKDQHLAHDRKTPLAVAKAPSHQGTAPPPTRPAPEADDGITFF